MAGGQLSTPDFKRVEDRAVDEAIALQEDAGVDVVTDGEMRRTHFIAPLTDVISGVKEIPAFNRIWRRPHAQGAAAEETEIQVQYAVVEKIRRQALAHQRGIHLRAADAPAAAQSHATEPADDDAAMVARIFARRLSGSIRSVSLTRPTSCARRRSELATLGCEYIQIDAPELGMLCDPERRRQDFAERGMDPERLLTDGIDILNSVADVPGVSFGLHLCRGNNKGYYVGEGGYEAIARQAFRRARNFSLWLLEYDDWRSGAFEPLRDIPPDKGVVLGLISTKRAELEPAEAIVRRIEEASRYFPRERLGLSTQCGFGTVWEGNPISEAIERDKLRLVAELARRVWR